MKVVLLSHSDTRGGAAIVTRRLMDALRAEGVDARMVVFAKTSDSDNVSLASTAMRRRVAFLAERADIFAHNGFNRADLFKVSTARTGVPVDRHPWVREADIVVLSWINQGLLSLDGIARIAALGKPVVWTMHDMWCMTGICHHALDCTAYERECGRCPFLGSRRPNDLSHKTWRLKRRLYDEAPITFVAVSRWLADLARRSSLLANRPIEVIPNAFPVDRYITRPTTSPADLGLPADRDIILFGAARLDDPIKGLDIAVDALNHLHDDYPAVAAKATAVFFGDIRNPELFSRLRLDYRRLGPVYDPERLHQLYASAKVVLSTSLRETLPTTLIEGQAAGCFPVTFGEGGQRDIVTGPANGYIARYMDARDVAAGIAHGLTAIVDRDALHADVERRFGRHAVATRYIFLFNNLLSNK
ncbi:MAG: glycosyltransferase [Muribaculaceae bacterium]|nr:glycosyltransferase [Muribaculaceae bacterium]